MAKSPAAAPQPAPQAAPAPARAPNGEVPMEDVRGSNPLPVGPPPTLPAWAKRLENGAIEVDSGKAYPAVFRALGFNEADLDQKLDQYWIETAMQCVKLKLQELIYGTEWDPNTNPDHPRALVITIPRNDYYKLTEWDPGKGVEAATKGREARTHYERIRNRF